MTSKPRFITKLRSLILRPRIFMTSPRSFMLSRLNKNESTASGNGSVLKLHFGLSILFFELIAGNRIE